MPHTHNLLLLSKLPGDIKTIVDVSSDYPETILAKLDNLDKQYDSVMFMMRDVWRYYDYEEEFSNHPNVKNLFIASQGYYNNKVNDHCYHLSYPIFFNWRPFQNFHDKQPGLKYGFGCLNNRPALHRLLLGTGLHKRGLIKDLLFTQYYEDSKLFPMDREIIYKTDGFEEYKKILPITFSENDFDGWFGLTHPAYRDCYSFIVTEAEVAEVPYRRNINLPVATEKTWKPFISSQVPIFLAAKGHLAYLKNLGFEIMEDLYPTGYDNMEVEEKVLAIVEIVSQGRDFIEDYYFKNLDKIKYNHELISSQTVDKLMLENIENCIYGNS